MLRVCGCTCVCPAFPGDAESHLPCSLLVHQPTSKTQPPFCSGMCFQKLNLTAESGPNPPVALTQRQHPFLSPPPAFPPPLSPPSLGGCSSTPPAPPSARQGPPACSPHFQRFSFLPLRPTHFTCDSCLNDKPMVLGFQTRLLHSCTCPFFSRCVFLGCNQTLPFVLSANHTSLQAPERAAARNFY